VSAPATDRVAIPRRTGETSDLTRAAVEALREMIVRRQLAPGAQIRQVELASRLGLSRSPLRQALSALETEGLVTHEQQRGYFVVRMSVDHLTQIYRMRELLETELLRTVRSPDADELAEFEARNDEIATAMADGEVARMLVANRAFHFGLFELSPLGAIRQDVERLWNTSEPYRATYLWLPSTRRRIIREHQRMLEALARGDTARLVQIADRHRAAARAAVTELLAVETC
jgi:DNA-binding GntR family transcriptional regulator